MAGWVCKLRKGRKTQGCFRCSFVCLPYVHVCLGSQVFLVQDYFVFAFDLKDDKLQRRQSLTLKLVEQTQIFGGLEASTPQKWICRHFLAFYGTIIGNG